MVTVTAWVGTLRSRSLDRTQKLPLRLGGASPGM